MARKYSLLRICPNQILGLPSLLFDGCEGPFLRGNWLGHNAEVKNVWNYTSVSHITKWCDA
jgi:hypothetical protein